MSRSNGAGTGRTGMQGIASTNSTLTEKYRRNGKLQSCESCRKSKLRCDHVVPACGRCVKRGKASQCFYHPNPLTQQVCRPLHCLCKVKLHQVLVVTLFKSQRSVPDPMVVWARHQNQSAVNRGRPGGFINASSQNETGRQRKRPWNSQSFSVSPPMHPRRWQDPIRVHVL